MDGPATKTSYQCHWYSSIYQPSMVFGAEANPQDPRLMAEDIKH